MTGFNRICLIFLCLITLNAPAQDSTAIFSFGLIADVQFADADTWGKRNYRGSLQRLENALTILNEAKLEFVVHAGDLIDRYYESFEHPLEIFQRSRAKVHYVIGNHEFSVPDSLKDSVRKKLGNERGYYAFEVDRYQFILLDAMDVSVHSSVNGSRKYRRALRMQQDLKRSDANNAHDYNGAIGPRQLRWLKSRLREGERKGSQSILFSHLPLLPENGLQLWNNKDVLTLLDSFPSVIAFISGHHHEGGYTKAGHIHHVTLKGLVEAQSETACGIAEVFRDKIVIRGFGDQQDYVLEY